MSFKNRNYNGLTCSEILIIIAIIIILTRMSFPNFTKGDRGNVRQKSCISNMRVIQGAIEFYNLDVDEKNRLHKLDDRIQELLVKGNYLKYFQECPESSTKKGKYLSKGDISEDGFIYCEYHGTQEGVSVTPSMTLSEYKAEKAKIEKEKARKKIWASCDYILEKYGLFVLIGLVMVIVLKDTFFKKKTKQ